MSGSTPTEWILDFAPTFKNGYKTKDSINKKRVNSVLTELSSSEDPASFGWPKDTPDGRVWVYEIGLKYRLSYRVDFHNKTIHLIRVCDHKKVYGKD